MKIFALILLAITHLLQAAHIDVFVLTGQSNSLGTTAGAELDVSPGSDPADSGVRFFWSNRATSSVVIGDSNGALLPLQSQQGGYYSGSSNHWGPEIAFSRNLYRAGVRNFAIVKASRGGGGNSFWLKGSSDDHMYQHIVQTVQQATTQLVNQGHTFVIKGLLYLQGESDSTAEANEAGNRLKNLVDNLRLDLPNASLMHCVCGGISAAGTTRDVVRAQQAQIAGATSYIDYFDTTDLRPHLYDNLHFNKVSKIAVGERFAQSFFSASIVQRNYGKLVCIGDSITQGGNGRPSFRYELFKYLAGQNVAQSITNGYWFTGSVEGAYQNNSGSTPDVNGQAFRNVHDGHYGWRASWISARVALPSDRRSLNRGEGTLMNWTNQARPQQYSISNPNGIVNYPDPAATGTGNTGITYTPDTVCLMIGVNDLGDSVTPQQVSNDVSSLIDQLRAANPIVRIHLCEVLPTNQTAAMATSIQNLNALLVTLVNLKNSTSSGSPIWLVGVHAGFDAATMTYDNVHPNAAGEAHVGLRLAASMGLQQSPIGSAVSTAVVSDSLASADFPRIDLGNQIWSPAGYQNVWFESGTLTKSLTQGQNFRVISGTTTASWFEGTRTGWSSGCAGSWTAEVRMKCNANPNGFALWFGTGTRRIIIEVMGNATRDNGANAFNVSHNNLDGQFHTFRIVHDHINAKYHVFRDNLRLTPLAGVTYDATATDNRLILGDFTSGTFGNSFDVEIESVRYSQSGTYLPVEADFDADGLRDTWEWKWYASFTAALPAGDDDGDGSLNLEEQANSSDPWNPNSKGPQPPSATLRKTSQVIPRFGRHQLLQLTVSNPTSSSVTLDSLSLDLINDSSSRVASAYFLDSGSVEDYERASIVSQIMDPTAQWNINANLAIAPGIRFLWIMIEPKRDAELQSVIEASLSALVINSSTIIPDQINQDGKLTIGMVPLFCDVVKSGDLGIHTFRIPGIVTDRRGFLHAVYDHRYDGSGDLPANIDVGYSRSEDGGVTWSSSRVILDFDAAVSGSSGNGVGDPSILYDPVTDTLWTAALWSQGNRAYNGSGPGLLPSETGQYVLTKSTDGGINWSSPINITNQIKDPVWKLLFCAPGHGIAMRDGTIAFPSQMRRETDGLVRMCFVFSRDHGATWQFGSVIPETSPQTNENEMLELDDGRLLFSARTPSGSNGQRAWAYYTPSGGDPLKNGNWSSIFRLASVPDPVCQGSLAHWKSMHAGHPVEWIVFSNPAGGGRTGGTLRLSDDGGQSWPYSRLLYAGSYAYSCISILPDGSIGVLFERDNYTKITFARIEEGWLLNYDQDRDRDGMPDQWEEMHGLNPDSAMDASLDSDGDGIFNHAEYLAKTHPGRGNSRFQIAEISPSGIEPHVRFSAIPYQRYRLESSENLQHWFSHGAVTADRAQMKIAIPPSSSSKRFYRVRNLP
ncbi:MAG: sialate O-acetylesterase [Akkermansiaceae bacterium]